LFKVSDACYVDSEDPSYSIWTRYLNHGSTPNVRVKSVERGRNGRPRVWFVATRDVEPGDELLWDYGEDYWYADDIIA
jgi:SET domain-containing protein